MVCELVLLGTVGAFAWATAEAGSLGGIMRPKVPTPKKAAWRLVFAAASWLLVPLAPTKGICVAGLLVAGVMLFSSAWDTWSRSPGD